MAFAGTPSRYGFSRLLESEYVNRKVASPFSNRKISSSRHRRYVFCSMSMNGFRGDTGVPVERIEIRSFPAVQSHAAAVESLSSAIAELKSNPPPSSSGIIRLQVPIHDQIQGINWLYSQNHFRPRCFFSSRREAAISDHLGECDNGYSPVSDHRFLSIAGIGSAVVFQGLRKFSYEDWKSIRRFLSNKFPAIRAYGAVRFDALARTSSEWEAFGSFYFMIPQVEFDELNDHSILAANVAWDDALSWNWERAVDAVEITMSRVSSNIAQLQKELPLTSILSLDHLPNQACWETAVNKALQKISHPDSRLTKVVLARRSRLVTSIDIDPIAWIACLGIQGDDSYQFCLQPPNAPAFIGNTPEQLFRRKGLAIRSEALAATRARGRQTAHDLEIELDLLSSPKDDLEFSVVRESIRKKLEAVCSNGVEVKPKKMVRKLPRVQHLYAQLAGRLKSEGDEFDILSSLHPTPAVCGCPTEEARWIIADTEVFDRGMYAAPIGWFGGGESEFAVGIRSALVEEGHGATMYAGTGIVKGSDPSSEWNELELKISQFTKLLKLGLSGQIQTKIN